MGACRWRRASASSVRSRSRSLPGPAAPARHQWRACVSRISRSPNHRTCARRARHPVTRRRTRSTRRPQRAGAVCSGATQWIALDFGREYEYGGIVVNWEPGAEARAFDVQSSADGTRWTTLWSARQAEGERSYVYLPGGGHSRHLRLHLLEAAEGAAAFGIRALDVRPFEFSRSLRRVLPRRRGGRASRSFAALAAPRAVLLDIGRRRGRIERRDHERGGHARARSRLSVARTVPVRGRRAGHVGGRRARDRARARLPADPVLDVATSRSRSDHDGLRRRGSHRSRRACLVPRRERRRRRSASASSSRSGRSK